jgi:hypothetical protein
MTPLWFWEHAEPRTATARGLALGFSYAVAVSPDPEVFRAGEEAGKSLARQRANEKRHQDAQLTDEEQKRVDEYRERNPTASKRQAERDLGIPRHKIKWPGPRP